MLMASDILIYNADLVPVGEDQKQHIELTRDLAQKFNNTFSETFTLPEPFIPKAGARVMSLQSPDSKMSKSDPNQNGTLYITDSPDVLRKKIMSAVTDSESSVRYAKEKPGISNLMQIMGAMLGRTVESIEAEFAGKGYGDFKKAVADAVIAGLEPVRNRYAEICADKSYVEGMTERLRAATGATVVITGVEQDGLIGELIFDGGKPEYVLQEKVPKFSHGTGDIFAAAFTARYLNGDSLASACAEAGKLVADCLKATADWHGYGVQFEDVLFSQIKK